ALNDFHNWYQSLVALDLGFTGVIPTTSVSRPRLKSNPKGDRVLHSNSHGKKLEVEEHRRNVKLLKNKMSVTACNDSLNAKTVNVTTVSAMCAKCVMIKKHDLCVPKSVDKPLRKTVASDSIKKPRNNLIEIVLFIVDSGEVSRNVAGDGFASIKRQRRDQLSDIVRIMAIASGRGRLKRGPRIVYVVTASGAQSDAKIDDTWAWVAQGPERQQVVMAGALEVVEDVPVVDEAAQAIPAPIQAPQPPSVTRFMPRSMAMIEEYVRKIRGALGEQREVVDVMVKDFS
nr:hypothetical protein [Tanacetum cinerariifolium]